MSHKRADESCALRQRLPPRRRRGRLRAALVAVALLAFVPATHAAATRGGGADDNARVADSVLGVKVGMSLEEARAKLKDSGTYGGRDTRDGGRKEQWTMKKTPFTYVVYQTDGKGRVKWVTGFVRPGKEIPFAKLGDLARATRSSELEASWNVERPEGNYRLLARGARGKAQVVHLLTLALPPM